MYYKIINATERWFSFMLKYFNWHKSTLDNTQHHARWKERHIQDVRTENNQGWKWEYFCPTRTQPYSRLQSTAVLLSSFCFVFVLFVQCHASWISCDCKAWPFEHQLHHCACDVQFPVNIFFDSILADTHLKSPVPVKPRVDIFGLFVILMQLISMHKTLSWLFAFPGTK